MAKAKAPTRNDFSLVSEFKGYRNREDKTNLPPGYLVVGSQNVLTTTASRISIRKGYTLYGQASATILTEPPTAFDWVTSMGQERHLRSGSDNLQYLYVDSSGTPTWRDLMTGLSAVAFNYTTFFLTNTEKISVMLFVNGSSNIYMWSGGITTLASVTGATITKQGTDSWARTGFLVAGTRTVVIDGIVYTYTGGETTTTLTGVTPDPTLGGHAVGAVIHQGVRTTTNAGLSGSTVPTTFTNGLIEVLNNQIYLGALSGASSNNIYISKVNDYTDFGFTSPVRVVGEGALITLKGTPTAFVPQESEMYMCVVPDQWYQTKFTLSSDLSKEQLTIVPLKTAAQQAALSQAAVTKIKNSVVMLTRETTLDELGRVANVVLTPQATNYSEPIKNDFDAYDFTNAASFYWRYFIYVAVPAEGLVRVFNIARGYWEAPLILPVSRFSIIDGELYGHAYTVQETYKLFDGLNDNGNPISAIAAFSFQNFGTRSQSKTFNEFYTEGYIAGNTLLTLGIQYEIDGCATNTYMDLDGNTPQFVCLFSSDASLGKVSLGKNPLGGQLNLSAFSESLPPKFRWIPTMPPKSFYEIQPTFSSYQVDAQWELLAFGPKVAMASDDNAPIKQ